MTITEKIMEAIYDPEWNNCPGEGEPVIIFGGVRVGNQSS